MALERLYGLHFFMLFCGQWLWSFKHRSCRNMSKTANWNRTTVCNRCWLITDKRQRSVHITTMLTLCVFVCLCVSAFVCVFHDYDDFVYQCVSVCLRLFACLHVCVRVRVCVCVCFGLLVSVKHLIHYSLSNVNPRIQAHVTPSAVCWHHGATLPPGQTSGKFQANCMPLKGISAYRLSNNMEPLISFMICLIPSVDSPPKDVFFLML